MTHCKHVNQSLQLEKPFSDARRRESLSCEVWRLRVNVARDGLVDLDRL